MPPGLAIERLRTTMRLEQDGRITGESVTEASGPCAGRCANSPCMLSRRVLSLDLAEYGLKPPSPGAISG
jgi:hypothetical protein